MAKFEFKGIEDYIKMLEDVNNHTGNLCKAVVYAGADVLADEVRAQMKKLKTVGNGQALRAYEKKEPTYISTRQLKSLEWSLGIAPIKESKGLYHTRIGWDDYNDIHTERWPNGQPNALIARSCNNGSTAMLKQPFIKRAIATAGNPAVKAMDEEAQEYISKIMKKNGG